MRDHLGQRLRPAEEDGGQHRSADLLVGQGSPVEAEVQQPVDQGIAAVRSRGAPVPDDVGDQLGELPVGHPLGRHVLDARVTAKTASRTISASDSGIPNMWHMVPAATMPPYSLVTLNRPAG